MSPQPGESDPRQPPRWAAGVAQRGGRTMSGDPCQGPRRDSADLGHGQIRPRPPRDVPNLMREPTRRLEMRRGDGHGGWIASSSRESCSKLEKLLHSMGFYSHLDQFCGLDRPRYRSPECDANLEGFKGRATRDKLCRGQRGPLADWRKPTILFREGQKAGERSLLGGQPALRLQYPACCTWPGISGSCSGGRLRPAAQSIDGGPT